MKLTAGVFKNIRYTGALLLLVVLAATAGGYLLSVDQQQRYLTSRNFRLLSVLATHTDSLLTSAAGVFKLALDERRRDSQPGPDAETTAPGATRTVARKPPTIKEWIRTSQGSIPFLRDVEVEKPSAADPLPTPQRPVEPRLTLPADGTRRVQVTFSESNKGEYLSVKLGLSTLLGESFDSKLRQGAFDTLVLATPDGRVLLATGRRQQELQSISLDTILKDDPARGVWTFQQLARTITVADAVIAGVNYKVFMQPCCGAIASSAAGRVDDNASGLVVAGIVESAALRSASLAISPTLVIVGIVSTLLALVLWPFLKFTLLGERQRITQWDVLQLAACSVFGLALGAIIVVTADVYGRLRADLDIQLEGLAHELSAHARHELAAAYGHLSALEQAVDVPCRGAWNGIQSAAAAQRTCRAAGTGGADHVKVAVAGQPLSASQPKESGWTRDDFETFSLINQDGEQVVKMAPGRWVPTRIPVQARSYFRNVQQQRDLIPCPGPDEDKPSSARCFVEAVWSWTNGKPQAVLSTRVARRSAPSTGAERPYAVAALAIPMKSLIGPALPPGFEYAVVDRSGQVLFHSDPQRNVYENMFVETDQNRRLRALIAGHSEGWVDTMYWGRSYRAYIFPAGIGNWSVDTLADQRSLRGLLLEWTTVSLLLLSAYLLAWFVMTVVAARFGLSWLWPDPLRRNGYLLLAVAGGVFLIVFAGVACAGDSSRVLTVGVEIAAAAPLCAFVVLRRRPAVVTIDNTPGSTSATPIYKVAGALFLIISGIVPGVAFSVRSYDVHVHSYIKHRELGFAQAVAARGRGTPAQVGSWVCGRGADPSRSLDRYCSFFYGMRATPVDASNTRAEAPHQHEDLLGSLVEEYLPYYAESSVEMRELLHWTAADGSWRSRQRDARLLLELRQDFGNTSLQVSSVLPRPEPMPDALWRAMSVPGSTLRAASVDSETSPGTAADGDDDEHPDGRLLMPNLAPLLLVALGWAAYVIVSYGVRHVFLAGVDEPLWASGHLVATAGDNVLVLCGEPSQMAAQFQDVLKLDLGPIVRSTDPVAAWRAARIRISNAEAGRAVAISDLMNDVDDVEVTHKKLQLLGDLVNDPSRTVVVLVEKSPAVLQDIIRPGQEAQDRGLWNSLAGRFILVDWRDAPTGAIAVESRPPAATRRRSGRLQHILDEEGRYDRSVRQVCTDIGRSQAYQSCGLTPERLLDEITERVSTYYENLWNRCSDDEQVVLSHVAQYGLANVASRRAVRRLLARRLLIKDPELRLMNRTFRDFILTPAKLTRVTQFEGSAEPSTWDRLRLPFAMTAAAAAAFLFTTQRDMFNETVTVIAGVATAVPTLAQALSKIAGWDASAAARPNA